MTVMQVTAGGAYALSLAVVVAVIYLIVVRFMDLNEKESWWAIGLVFLLGVAAAALLSLLASPAALALSTFWGALLTESAKFVAFAAGVPALAAVARSRGWSEINGLMDGIVYGTAAGLGFATGEAFVRELAFGGAVGGLIGGGPLNALWTTALAGLSDGLFGAIIGMGFGAAVGARSAAQRVLYPLAGLAGAVVVHALYDVLARGNALGGSAALVRAWVALLIPVAFVLAVMVFALARERSAIREELAGETDSGVVTAEELDTLQGFAARRAQYARTFMKGDFDGWLALRELHNRQVQLALAKRRASRESDAERRAETEAEVHSLRASILETRQELGGSTRRSDTGEAGA
jgi:protease PrsW